MANIIGHGQLAIEALVEARRQELQLTRVQLVTRAGYTNTDKGLRRLCELFNGELVSTRTLVAGLPIALELPVQVLADAVEKTRGQIESYERAIAESAEAEWRANFRPHACILTEHRIPQPIFIAAWCRSDRELYVEFDANGAPTTYAGVALAAVRKRIAAMNGSFPGFGAPVGFVLNYTPDRAVRFDMNGIPREVLEKAYRLGRATLFLKGDRSIPAAVFRRGNAEP